MTEWLAQLALSSLVSLAIGAAMLGMLVLLARRLDWLNGWREPWLAAAVLTFASFCLGFLPVVEKAPTIKLSLPALTSPSPVSPLVVELASETDGTAFFWQWGLLAWGLISALGATISLARLMLGQWRLTRLVRQGKSLPTEGELARHLGVLDAPKELRLVLVEERISPFATALPKPTLALSQWALDNLSLEQIRLVVRHELEHLARRDPLAVLGLQWMTALLWFNWPLKALAKRAVDALEQGCDEQVLRKESPNRRRAYAEAMLKALRQTATAHGNDPVAAFSTQNKRSFTLRIRHILNGKQSARKGSNKALWSMTLAGGVLVLGLQPQLALAGKVAEAFINPLPEARVTSGFGMRPWPIKDAEFKKKRLHRGIDLAAPRGTRVQVPKAGEVTFSGTMGASGEVVIIDHGQGVETLYAHLDKRLVNKGDRVERGQILGLVGSTGKATGPHLHWELHRDGKVVDPASQVPVLAEQ
ncbi:M23/M56 family metallopeptidase [Microbulbifer rhizosphaerae]|uniref:Murein DD-endopeptidase MepM/ murein hydrolase activator NlpD n=1 Tax=Microbulbifer rhizosphaerae TaxID=1562603 RepID=A0A7W4W851_9GAMM|nr:M23/M56 family metallopeptidase [Microbulbifer rhizosphaerae]MBB3059244.1 murein DD-endopeptidase MepM/ murein hydrolase activator NlpD [Microbulbifer rhizosphaerae]